MAWIRGAPCAARAPAAPVTSRARTAEVRETDMGTFLKMESKLGRRSGFRLARPAPRGQVLQRLISSGFARSTRAETSHPLLAEFPGMPFDAPSRPDAAGSTPF